MVHIKPKRPPAPVPFLQAIVNEVLQADTEAALTPVLEKFDSPFHFERPEERNLVNWYKVLNRFDDLLERYISERNILAVSRQPDHGKQPSTSSTATNLRPSPSFAPPAESSATPTSSRAQSSNPVSAAPNASESASTASARIFIPSQQFVLLLLRLTQRLLRNASHDTRNVFNSVEHIGALLADDSSAIVSLSLDILNMLTQCSTKFRTSRVAMTLELTDRLLELAQGWGGRENGLGLLEACSSTQFDELSAEGKKLIFEFTKTSADTPTDTPDSEKASKKIPAVETHSMHMSGHSVHFRPNAASAIPLPSSVPMSQVSETHAPSVKGSGATRTLFIEDASAFEGDERWLLSDFAKRSGVPRFKWFSLLCAFRRAKRFAAGRDSRLEAAVLRLQAMTTVAQLHPLPLTVQENFGKEPELIHDIVALARSSPSDGVGDIPKFLRVIAIRCLSAMTVDRHRVGAITSAAGVSQHHGALPSLLRAEMSSLMATSASYGDGEDASRMDAMAEDSDGPAMPAVNSDKNAKSNTTRSLSLLAEAARTSPLVQPIQTAEALLSLVHTLAYSSGTSGATPLANSGVLAILIPALSDRNPRHARVVAQAIRTMQAIIEGSARTVGCRQFRDLGGLTLAGARVAAEVGIAESTESDGAATSGADEAIEVEALRRRGETRELYKQLAERQMTAVEALENQPPSSSAASRGLLPHSKWALLRALHQLILSSLASGGNEVRELVANTSLALALRKILAQPFHHGGSLFLSAANVATDIAYAEPTATPELVKAGIAQAVLRAISVGLPPCGEAVKGIPNLLAALCLAPTASDSIVSSSPLKPYLLRLATPYYTRAMHGEIPLQVGNSLDELMRHVQALRPDGNRAISEYLEMSAKFVSTENIKPSMLANRISSNNGRGYEPDAHKPEKRARSGDLFGPSGSGGPQLDGESTHPDVVLLDKMKLAVANNSCRLVGFAQGSAEHHEGVVNSGGLKHIITLRLAPALACPEARVRDVAPFSRHYPTPPLTIASLVTSLRNFSSRHGTDILKALFETVFEDASKVLSVAKELDDCWLPEEDDLIPTDSSGSNCEGDESSEARSIRRKKLRVELEVSIRKLNVEVVLLCGLSRGGPGSSSGMWEGAGGSQIASIISTVERAVRYHLAIVYTGLSLSASGDGDLSMAFVSAAADPTLKPIRPEQVTRVLGDVSKVLNCNVLKNKRFEELCSSYKVPPEGFTSKQDVKGLAWHLVTFAVATQRLYSNLSRGLLFISRRHSRDPSRYGASAKALAATIGQIFALHFRAAVPLWDVKVLTMGKQQVVSAWDYVRGILIEVKGTLFDDSRSMTQNLLLKAFLEAGGREALLQAVRPAALLEASSPLHDTSEPSPLDPKELDALLKKESLTRSSFVFALSDLFKELRESPGYDVIPGLPPLSKNTNEDTTSSDSVTNQACAISRMVVGDADTRSALNASAQDIAFRKLISGEKSLDVLRGQTKLVSKVALEYCSKLAVRKIAGDAWTTLCSFLYMLACCPGLTTPNSSAPDVLTPSEEWAPHDTHRSALNTVLQLTLPMAKQAPHLLATQIPDSTALTDVMGIVHATSTNFQELCLKTAASELNAEMEDWEDFMEPHEETPSSRPLSPDPELVQNLVEMGFSESRARMALRDAPGGIQFAAELLLSSPDMENSSDGSGAEDARAWVAQDEDQNGDENEDDADEEEDDDGHDNSNGDDDVDDDNDDDDDDDDDGGDDGDGESEDEDLDLGSSDFEGTDEDIEARAVGNRSLQDDRMVDASEVGSPAVRNEGESPIVGEASIGPPDSIRPSRSGSGRFVPRKSDNIIETSEPVSKIAPKPSKSVESDSSFLLTRSAHIQMISLRSAIRVSSESPEVKTEELCKIAARHVGLRESVPTDSEGAKDVGKVTPVPVEKFKATKKEVFAEMIELTKAIIEAAKSPDAGSHLPYVAIELLSTLQKDGTLSADNSGVFAALLTEGLGLTLPHLPAPSGPIDYSLQRQTASLWAHFGGINARKSLEKCGAFQMVFNFVRGVVDEWRDDDFIDEDDASEPIEKLRITEGDGDKVGVGSCMGGTSRLLGRKRGRAGNRVSSLHIPSRDEVVQLKQLTTCMLFLDARIRYKRNDNVVEASQIADKAERDEAADEMNGDVKGEKMEDAVKMNENMDLDRTGNRDGENTNGESTAEQDREGSGNGDAGSVKKPTPSLKRGLKESDVEMKDPDGGPTLEEVRKAALKKRDVELKRTRKHVADLTKVKEDEMEIGGADLKEVMLYGMRILRFLRHQECGDAMIGVLQMLAGLTRNWQVAEYGRKNGLIEILLGLPHLERRLVRSVDCQVVRMFVRTILRHVVEDWDTLLEEMECEIRGVASGAHRPPRSNHSQRSLIEATAPLAARNMDCYLTALHNCVMSTSGDRMSHIDVLPIKTVSAEEVEKQVEKRDNVRQVVNGLCGLLVISSDSSDVVSSSPESLDGKKHGEDVYELQKYALKTLAEITELSRVAAVALIKCPSPLDTHGKDTALDYIIQKLLPLGLEVEHRKMKVGGGVGLYRMDSFSEAQEVTTCVQRLFTSLCSKGAGTHVEAVEAFARAVSGEAKKEKACSGLIKGIAQSFAPGTRPRVFRAVLKSDLANDLGVCLQKLDLSCDSDVQVSVLRALALFGQAG